jgi:hypothetical protein
MPDHSSHEGFSGECELPAEDGKYLERFAKLVTDCESASTDNDW